MGEAEVFFVEPDFNRLARVPAFPRSRVPAVPAAVWGRSGRPSYRVATGQSTDAISID